MHHFMMAQDPLLLLDLRVRTFRMPCLHLYIIILRRARRNTGMYEIAYRPDLQLQLFQGSGIGFAQLGGFLVEGVLLDQELVRRLFGLL